MYCAGIEKKKKPKKKGVLKGKTKKVRRGKGAKRNVAGYPNGED